VRGSYLIFVRTVGSLPPRASAVAGFGLWLASPTAALLRAICGFLR
jgi:hypothetical protein